MINVKRIEEIKRLSAEAADGNWRVTLDDPYDRTYVLGAFNRTVTVIADIKGDNDAKFIAESRQFVPDIIAAYEFQLERLGAHDTVIKGLSEMVERRDAEIAELRKALEFYADERNSKPYKREAGAFHSKYSEDNGMRAKEALAWRNTTRK